MITAEFLFKLRILMNPKLLFACYSLIGAYAANKVELLSTEG